MFNGGSRNQLGSIEAEASVTAPASTPMLKDVDYVTVLWYSYATISNPSDMRSLQEALALELELKGRIRVSSEGINGCLGGTRTSIQSYINRTCDDKVFEEIKGSNVHWKVSGLVDNPQLPPNKQMFEDLSVKVTKEVVSLDLSAEDTMAMLRAEPAKALSPEAFHSYIASCESDGSAHKDFVLIDVRNFYESRIGAFKSSNVPTLDPHTRQFSEFARVMGQEPVLEELKSKKGVLMYCTGGVRCERASQYLRSKGVNNLFQLAGGIHSYQEAFPDGGYFKGKNFVYDPRLATGYANKSECVGKCQLCNASFDDYRHKNRCYKCRVLVLVCNECNSKKDLRELPLLCEFCC